MIAVQREQLSVVRALTLLHTVRPLSQKRNKTKQQQTNNPPQKKQQPTNKQKTKKTKKHKTKHTKTKPKKPANNKHTKQKQKTKTKPIGTGENAGECVRQNNQPVKQTEIQTANARGLPLALTARSVVYVIAAVVSFHCTQASAWGH